MWTIIDSPAVTPACNSAASKMLGCGFMKPCSDEEIAADISPFSSKCS